MFSGDLVFAGSIGRSDFANGDPVAMRTSLQRFLTLPDELPVFPGHGPDTTVGRERDSNPFLRELGLSDAAPPRGTQDLLPPVGDAMVGLYEESHRLGRLFGYRYVETPTFEHTELFVRTSGGTSDVVTKEMYTFEDKGGRSLTLRPEGTAGVMRAYLDHAQELPNPFKGYYVETFFRHGRPQAGRLREFRQFGVEVIGDAGPGSDVEVIAVGDAFLRDRGLRQVTLLVNSIGDEVCRPAYRERLVAYFEPFLDRSGRGLPHALAQQPACG